MLDLIKNLPNVSSIKLNIVCCDQKCKQPKDNKREEKKKDIKNKIGTTDERHFCIFWNW